MKTPTLTKPLTTIKFEVVSNAIKMHISQARFGSIVTKTLDLSVDSLYSEDALLKMIKDISKALNKLSPDDLSQIKKSV